MVVGSIGFACHSGLGHLLRDFHREGIVDPVMVIHHPHYQNYSHWYPARFQSRDRDRFLDCLDVLLLFENGHDWPTVRLAKERGKRVVLIPNYEYTPYPIPVEPDLVLCASALDVDFYKSRYRTHLLPIPVSMPWRLRERSLSFVHNAGHGGYDWREGTPELLEAMKLVKSPARLTVRIQPGEARTWHLVRDWERLPNVDLQYGERSDEVGLWDTGDVCVAPQKYNGMSLPLQEAFASGMLVLTTRRYPMITWLPTEPMFDPKGTERHKGRLAVEIERCILSPENIAAAIDYWYDRDVRGYSQLGKEWGERNSWEALRPKYLEALHG
jgi:hypothetical protein